jgi:mediator of RNA polymerase II transcription subunit 10
MVTDEAAGFSIGPAEGVPGIEGEFRSDIFDLSYRLVHDNQGTQQSQNALTVTTNKVISQLSGLTSSPFTQQYPIPVDVISYIEDGRNPDIYTREFIEVTAKSNARLKGKMQGFAKLRDVLSEKLVKECPRLSESVNDIVRRTTPGDK